MQPAGQGRDLRHGTAGFVVNEQRQASQIVRGSHKKVVLSFRQVSGSQIVAIDSCGDREEPFGQFKIRLFQTEQENALTRLSGHRLGHVTDEGRLSHTRTSCKNDQFCLLKASRLMIEVCESGRDAGHIANFVHSLINAIERLHQDIGHRDAGCVSLFFQDTENTPLSALQQALDIFCGVVALAEDIGTCINQTTLHPFFADDIRVISHVGSMWDRFQNMGKVSCPADRFEVASSNQFFCQSNCIDAADAVFVEPLNGRIDLLVSVTIEVFCLQ